MKIEVHPGEKYQHYTGKCYQVLGLARHSETEEEMVVYQALYHCAQFGEHALWVRPKAMFIEEVIYEGQKVPRFKRLCR